MTGGWAVEEVTGPAAELHAASSAVLRAGPSGRRARILRAERPAVVLGSHQPEEWFDPAAVHRAGFGLARRHSGGGAVMVGVGHCVWVDFVLPAGDPLWDDDVGRAAWWVGELWADAIGAAGLATGPQLEVWRGAMRASAWSAVVCFAGMGSGEVEMGGLKVVGVSQRRTRAGVLFQTAALLAWEPEAWWPLLSPEGRRVAVPAGTSDPEGPSGVALGLGPAAGPALVTALMGCLMP